MAAPCVSYVASDQSMFNKVQREVQTGLWVFVPFASLNENTTLAHAVRLRNLDEITGVFLSTHAMIERAVLEQQGQTTYEVEANSGRVYGSRGGSLGDSVRWLRVEKAKELPNASDTTRIFKITRYHRGG